MLFCGSRRMPVQMMRECRCDSEMSLRLFGRRLLLWYDANKRDLPWRKNRDPYPVWLSEIMLQQTRVAAVVKYYARFLKRFPTVQALAMARVSSVLARSEERRVGKVGWGWV